MYTKIMDSPIGSLILRADDRGICEIRLRREGEMIRENAVCPLLVEAERQLQVYFTGQRMAFDLPLSMQGTPFERAVWGQLRAISYGETKTYGQIAAQLGKPAASRAVGAACGRNPLLIVVPCHRVVGGAGRLTGFAAGLDAKRSLLALEGFEIRGDRIVK